MGSRKSGIEIGDRAFLVRQTIDRGIVASGRFTSEIWEGEHWADQSKVARYANVRWDHAVWIDDRLTVEVLKSEVPEVTWSRLQGSGVLVDRAVGEKLDELWSEHLGTIGVSRAVIPEELARYQQYVEGAAVVVLVNSYERSPAARRACIDYWGTTCAACGFDFGSTYGALGQGFIHVHHLKDLSLSTDDYLVDPVNDLRPICPNCHAMLHTVRPAMSIEELKDALRRAESTTDPAGEGPVTSAVTATEISLVPMPRPTELDPPEIVWNHGEVAALSLGYQAASMDEKWSSCLEGWTLRIVRSWSGQEMFRADLQPLDGPPTMFVGGVGFSEMVGRPSARIVRLWADATEPGIGETDDERRAMLEWVIRSELLGQPHAFPVRAG